jgi:transposase InsO family protein
LRYLSDNAAVGSSWTNPLSATTTLNGTSVTLNATVKSTVEQKGGTLTINGKTYTNVITMRTEIQNATIQVSFFNLPIVFSTQQVVQFYAPKYGLIKRSAHIVASTTIPGNPPTNQELINTYTVDELMSSSIQ